MPDPNPQTDAGPASDAAPTADPGTASDTGLDSDTKSRSRDRPSLLAATPDADAVFEQLRTLALLAVVLGLLVTLIAAELLVRI
ncbi:hypothetical protein J2744_002500 [Halorubrum trapanicum]|uniref:Uncharacterized protein n=1 Tax=Halorubrum trapanicum TaxID=29284 RepID=A0A8J7R9J0_9EURY|nr:hypothetical protein [Halorubrum trapanicum]MBP1902804.1 hypothetical protein [Halorubrum trapanicum]